MGQSSKIEWTTHTFNPWRGCTHVSPGCEHCYAEALSKRNPAQLGTWGAGGTRVIASESYWRQPERWNRAAERAGTQARVFCASLADVFEDRPELVRPRRRLFALIADTPNLDWLLLTKRPDNARHMLREHYRIIGTNYDGAPIPNVWLGTTVEDQRRADERIPVLLDTPAAVRFISAEPLLGPVDVRPWLPEVGGRVECSVCGRTKQPRGRSAPLTGGLCNDDCIGYRNEPFVGDLWPRESRAEFGYPEHLAQRPTIDWVIVGGESGPKARPMDLVWARSLVEQGRAAGVPVFVKQLGARAWEWQALVSLRDRKGGDPDEWPADLRVREFPAGTV